jgi:hypothetical protein
MEQDCITIKSNALKMSWYMRGGATYNEILNMSLGEREAITKIIEENLETTKNTNMPFF